jgi:hypothetical protein
MANPEDPNMRHISVAGGTYTRRRCVWWPVLNLRVAKTNGPSETLRPKLPGKAFRRSADPPFSFRLQEWPNLESGVA